MVATDSNFSPSINLGLGSDKSIFVGLFTFFLSVHREEDFDPQDAWWPHEKQRGIRDVDIIRGRIASAGPNPKLMDVLRGPYQEGELERIRPPTK